VPSRVRTGRRQAVADMMLVLIGNGWQRRRQRRQVSAGARDAERSAHCDRPGGIVCGCGGRGCVETFASVTSIARRYTMAAKEAILAEEVVAKAEAGNPAAVRV